MSEIPELHDKLLNHTAPDLHICQDVPKIKKVTENGFSVLKNHSLTDLIKWKQERTTVNKSKGPLCPDGAKHTCFAPAASRSGTGTNHLSV